MISEEFREHLAAVMGRPNVHIYYIQLGRPELRFYPFVLVTDSVAVTTLPDPEMFRTFMISEDPEFVKKVRDYVTKLRDMGRRLNQYEELEELIRSGQLLVKPKRVAKN